MVPQTFQLKVLSSNKQMYRLISLSIVPIKKS